jgi:hypothetical protein
VASQPLTKAWLQTLPAPPSPRHPSGQTRVSNETTERPAAATPSRFARCSRRAASTAGVGVAAANASESDCKVGCAVGEAVTVAVGVAVSVGVPPQPTASSAVPDKMRTAENRRFTTSSRLVASTGGWCPLAGWAAFPPARPGGAGEGLGRPGPRFAGDGGRRVAFGATPLSGGRPFPVRVLTPEQAKKFPKVRTTALDQVDEVPRTRAVPCSRLVE